MNQARNGLLGHWPVTVDTNDHGPNRRPTEAVDVELGHTGPGGKSNTAARFNGRRSQLIVADDPSLRLGVGDFTFAAWLCTDDIESDVVGDIAGKFDPRTRRGFNLLVLTSDGVTCAAQANRRHLQFGIDDGRIESAWRDHGRPGAAVKICALTSAKGSLFAGTFERGCDEVGRLWRHDGGQNWIDLGNPEDCNSVYTIAEHEGELFVGTARYKAMGSALGETLNQKPGGRIYRVSDEGTWTDCGHPGAEDATPESADGLGYETGKADAATALISYRGRLYAMHVYRRGVFQYEGGTSWSEVGKLDLRALSMTVYRGSLYVLMNDGPVCRLADSDQWEHCGTPPGSTQTYSAVTHRGQMYAGTWPNGEVMRYDGGQTWQSVGRAGYELEVMAGAQYNGKAYWGGLPMANVYRMEEDGGFTMVGNLDQAVAPLRRVWAMATHEGRLFAGTLPSGRVMSVEAGKIATWDRTLPGGWHHVAAVRDAGVLKLYLDGRTVSCSTRFHGPGLDISNDQPLRIGFGAYEHFDGLLSDARLYGRALDYAEVAQLAQP